MKHCLKTVLLLFQTPLQAFHCLKQLPWWAPLSWGPLHGQIKTWKRHGSWLSMKPGGWQITCHIVFHLNPIQFPAFVTEVEDHPLSEPFTLQMHSRQEMQGRFSEKNVRWVGQASFRRQAASTQCLLKRVTKGFDDKRGKRQISSHYHFESTYYSVLR